MSTIKELRKEYAVVPDKSARMEIAEKMFEKEQGIFEFCEFMKDNPCREICIQENEVYATYDIQGIPIRMVLDKTDMAAVPYTILMKGFYEQSEFNMVMKLLPYLGEHFRVFDVGANLGWYGMNIKKRCPDCKVDFFEPVPNTFCRLKKNIAMNDITDCAVNNIGFIDKTETTTFFYDTVASGASSMTNLRELPTTEQIDVQMKTMDEYVAENHIERLDFIKCDVEGAEFLVYRGGENVIAKYQPIIFSEMLRKWSAKFHYHPNDIIDFLSGLGYQCYVIREGWLKTFERVDEQTVETNYFFLHKEKHSKIIRDLCR